MNTWLTPLYGGLLGTMVMTVFLLMPRWMKWGKTDIIPAVGSLIVGRRKGAFLPGLIVHLSMGVMFAYLYVGFLDLSHLPVNAMTGLLLGSVHGVIVMLLASIMIMEHHPITNYHEKGLGTGLAQLLAHMLYGATVGWVVGMMS